MALTRRGKQDGTSALTHLVNRSSSHGRIFDRLVRLGGGSNPGYGLGLSMVAAIASAHNGSVMVAPTVKGLAIEIRLPISRIEG